MARYWGAYALVLLIGIFLLWWGIDEGGDEPWTWLWFGCYVPLSLWFLWYLPKHIKAREDAAWLQGDMGFTKEWLDRARREGLLMSDDEARQDLLEDDEE